MGASIEIQAADIISMRATFTHWPYSLRDGLNVLSSGKQTVLPLNKLKTMINLWKAPQFPF